MSNSFSRQRFNTKIFPKKKKCHPSFYKKYWKSGIPRAAGLITAMV